MSEAPRLAGAALAALLLAGCAHPGPLSVTVDAPSVEGASSDVSPDGPSLAAGRASPLARRPVWARRLGGPGSQEVADLAVDVAGNVAIAGTFFDTADFGVGPLQVPASTGGQAPFVALLDEGGRARWSITLGGAMENDRLHVAFDGEGNVIVAGGISAPAIDLGLGPLPPAGAWDVLVAKIDPSGRPLWARRFGGPGWQTAGGLAVDAAGDILVAGSFTGAPIDFGLGPLPSAGRAEVFVVALDPRGAPRWNRSAGANAQLTALTASAGGEAVMAGHFFQTFDIGPAPLQSSGDRDAFVAALDPLGQPRWSRRLGSVAADSASAIALDRAGAVAVVGENRGPMDYGPRAVAGASTPGAYVALLEPAGQKVRWARSTGNWGVTSAVFDGAGNLFLLGVMHQTLDFNGGRRDGRPLPVNQASVVALSPRGTQLWSRSLGSSPPGAVVSAAVDVRNDDLLVAFTVFGDADLGTGPLPGPGRNVLVVKLAR